MLKEKIMEPQSELVETNEGVGREAITPFSSKKTVDKHLFDTMRAFVEERVPEIDISDEKVLKLLFISEFHRSITDLEKQMKEGEEILAVVKDDPRMVVFFESLLSGFTVKEAILKAELKEYETSANETAIDPNAKMENRDAVVGFICEKCGEDGVMANDFIDFITLISDKIAGKKIDKELIASLWKSFVFDKELGESFEKGKLEGKNQKIESKMESRVNRDGICSPSSGVAPAAKTGYIERLLNRQ